MACQVVAIPLILGSGLVVGTLVGLGTFTVSELAAGTVGALSLGGLNLLLGIALTLGGTLVGMGLGATTGTALGATIGATIGLGIGLVT